MQDESLDRWLISVCGLNCAECDIYAAGHGDEGLRNEVVEWFRKERDEDVKPEEVNCEGCRRSLDFHWSPECKILLCARNKDKKYCFQCEGFPCEILDEFSSDGISHHKRTVQNLKKMKEVGIDAWIEEQRRRGKCVFCP